jgi:hypothetical protein
VPYSGSSVTVTAKNSKGTELFVGSASGVDADSYLDGVAQEQISDVSFPNSASHRFTPGDAKPEADIADRDWWISRTRERRSRKPSTSMPNRRCSSSPLRTPMTVSTERR